MNSNLKFLMFTLGVWKVLGDITPEMEHGVLERSGQTETAGEVRLTDWLSTDLILYYVGSLALLKFIESRTESQLLKRVVTCYEFIIWITGVLIGTCAGVMAAGVNWVYYKLRISSSFNVVDDNVIDRLIKYLKDRATDNFQQIVPADQQNEVPVGLINATLIVIFVWLSLSVINLLLHLIKDLFSL